MTLTERQQSLIEDLNLIQDPHERLAALSSYSRRTALPEDFKSDSLLVPGCVSRVWVHGEKVGDLMRYCSDADSPMVKNLVAVLCHLYSEVPATEVVAIEPQIWQACGFHKMLSPTRMNGLIAVRRRIRDLALAGTEIR